MIYECQNAKYYSLSCTNVWLAPSCMILYGFVQRECIKQILGSHMIFNNIKNANNTTYVSYTHSYKDLYVFPLEWFRDELFLK